MRCSLVKTWRHPRLGKSECGCRRDRAANLRCAWSTNGVIVPPPRWRLDLR
jgi:hypothetical protein